MSKNYILHSSQESRDKGTTSILAIVETIFFVGLTWGIAYYYDTYTHIYTAIAIAPFLLLRTPESTDKAIEWFVHEYKLDDKYFYKEPLFWIILSLISLLSFTLFNFFSTKILIHYKGLELFFLSMLLGMILEIGVGVALVGKGGGVIVVGVVTGVVVGIVTGAEGGIAVAGGITGVAVTIGSAGIDKVKNKILKNFILLLISPILLIMGVSFGLGLFLRSLFIKFIATFFYTLIHPKKTFFAISKNWNEQITVNDIIYTPELLPNIHKRDNQYQLSSFISGLNSDTLEEKILKLFIIPIWSLGYLYRFSIKSTAWFFFPLAYLANLNALQDEEKKSKAIKTQTWKKLFWFNIMISAVLFLYFRFTGQYLDLLGLSEKKLNFIQNIMTLLRQYFIPEAMWLLIIAVALYFILNLIISWKEHIEDKNYNILTYWLIKLIFMLWMVFLAWHLVILTNQYLLPELPKILGML